MLGSILWTIGVVVVLSVLIIMLFFGEKDQYLPPQYRDRLPTPPPPPPPKKPHPEAPSDPDARCVWMVRSFVKSYPHYSFRITGNVYMVINKRSLTTYIDVPCQITGIPYDIKNMDFSTAELTRCTFCLIYDDLTRKFSWEEKGKVSVDATGFCRQNPGARGKVEKVEYYTYDGASVVSAVGLGVGYGEASWGA